MAAPIGRLEEAVNERRLNRRYPIRLHLQYKVLRYGKVVGAGEGGTLNLSSAGALVRTEAVLPRGFPIDLTIAWPAELEGKVGLSLMISGTIMRVQGQTAAVAFSQYQFKTRTLRACDSMAEPAPANAVRTIAMPKTLSAAGE